MFESILRSGRVLRASREVIFEVNDTRGRVFEIICGKLGVALGEVR